MNIISRKMNIVKTESKPVRKKRIGCWLMFIVVLVAIVTTMAFTCPDKEKHQEAISQEVSTAVTALLSEKSKQWGLHGSLTTISSLVVPKMVDYMLNERVSVKNYFVSSTSEIEYNGKTHIVSAGAFGKVWVFFDSNDMEEYLEKQLERFCKEQVEKIKDNPIGKLVKDVTKTIGDALEKDFVGTIEDIIEKSNQE